MKFTTSSGDVVNSYYVTRSLFDMVRRLANGPDALIGGRKSAEIKHDITKQDALAAVFLGINVVEAFINIYFRNLAEEYPANPASRSIKADLNRKKSLEYKIKNWPNSFFGKSLT